VKCSWEFIRERKIWTFRLCGGSLKKKKSLIASYKNRSSKGWPAYENRSPEAERVKYLKNLS
jgi:hypothetical protein